MNNSQVYIPNDEPNNEAYQEREAKLERIIMAWQSLAEHAGWSSLKTEIFDDLTKRLRSQIFTEARKEVPDTLRLNRLAGQLEWAEKFSDPIKAAESYRPELVKLKNLSNKHGKPER